MSNRGVHSAGIIFTMILFELSAYSLIFLANRPFDLRILAICIGAIGLFLFQYGVLTAFFPGCEMCIRDSWYEVAWATASQRTVAPSHRGFCGAGSMANACPAARSSRGWPSSVSTPMAPAEPALRSVAPSLPPRRNSPGRSPAPP